VLAVEEFSALAQTISEVMSDEPSKRNLDKLRDAVSEQVTQLRQSVKQASIFLQTRQYVVETQKAKEEVESLVDQIYTSLANTGNKKNPLPQNISNSP
jgi:ElaB/YqjD/DUF883 family membrane-anchored ribosome-binding protein